MPPDMGEPMAPSSQRRLRRLLPWIVLLFLGTVWGLSFSLARIATVAGGTPFGITFWQSVVGGAILLVFTQMRGRPLPVSKRHLKIYVIVALLGASLPNSLFYFAAPHVQAGVLSITVALIPILTYGIAMVIGAERLARCGSPELSSARWRSRCWCFPTAACRARPPSRGCFWPVSAPSAMRRRTSIWRGRRWPISDRCAPRQA